jgi:ATP-dependent helicase HrpB
VPDGPPERVPLPDLPVVEAIPAVRSALDSRRRAVLVAPPGAGKTTVIPLALLDEEWLEGRRIVMLEPRRLATRAAARRMAHTGTDVGELVGYQTRDERRIGPPPESRCSPRASSPAASRTIPSSPAWAW